jgi:hypothetical protein
VIDGMQAVDTSGVEPLAHANDGHPAVPAPGRRPGPRPLGW